jgi:hypothetical protein
MVKLEDLDIVSRLRDLEFAVANGDVPKPNRPRFALMLWELEKQTCPFSNYMDGQAPEPTEGDWQPVPPPAPAPSDPVAQAIRAIRERQLAESDAVVERAIQALLQRLAGPAAKPLSAIPTQEIREPGQDAGRPTPLASDREG